MIIQDELHLMDGPLGTIAGLYEAGVDYLISKTGASPKGIGSSATLTMASEQDLYGSLWMPFESFLFGCSTHDNYFSQVDRSQPAGSMWEFMPMVHHPTRPPSTRCLLL